MQVIAELVTRGNPSALAQPTSLVEFTPRWVLLTLPLYLSKKKQQWSIIVIRIQFAAAAAKGFSLSQGWWKGGGGAENRTCNLQCGARWEFSIDSSHCTCLTLPSSLRESKGLKRPLDVHVIKKEEHLSCPAARSLASLLPTQWLHDGKVWKERTCYHDSTCSRARTRRHTIRKSCAMWVSHLKCQCLFKLAGAPQY